MIIKIINSTLFYILVLAEVLAAAEYVVISDDAYIKDDKGEKLIAAAFLDLVDVPNKAQKEHEIYVIHKKSGKEGWISKASINYVPTNWEKYSIESDVHIYLPKMNFTYVKSKGIDENYKPFVEYKHYNSSYFVMVSKSLSAIDYILKRDDLEFPRSKLQKFMYRGRTFFFRKIKGEIITPFSPTSTPEDDMISITFEGMNKEVFSIDVFLIPTTYNTEFETIAKKILFSFQFVKTR